ncbi:SGNH/GDSL hydrolase family protein [Aliifodinibius salicampi]|uniref:SGNH/GDSL hydrolase family protein n=1 Tax=Fodinibius salicampi TaxID=1920655 RepID=A0ABT3PWS0_9BACT|nr:SGNH/GDSL hydrolase family protein [Fodinibius salicampi]MCW9712296.1 SGNH/GDSL hydrolase family protein [Fodinibius salicampi]
MDYTRRNFLQTITAAALGAAGLALTPAQERRKSGDDFPVIPEDATILFQGDSITDAGRNKGEKNANSGLGSGYAMLATAHLRHKLAERDPQSYNRGISGNKVFQLADRWKEDALDIEPDLLSILIGVNDYWHTLNDYEGTVETYEQDFRSLLQRTKEQLPDVNLVIGEPFVVLEGSAVEEEDWLPDFRNYQAVAKEIAQDFEAAFIPYQSIFDKASQNVEPTYWTGDGVHPTLAGSQLMANGWLETVKRM